MVDTAVRSDEVMQEEILSQILWDSRISKPNNISVKVEKGVATLLGTVRSVKDSIAAEQDTVTSPGITRVQNLLKVQHPEKAGAPPTDEEIAENVRDVLLFNVRTDKTRLKVTSAGGFVTLEGSVDSLQKKRKAEELSSGVNGVVEVDDKLAVVPTKLPRDQGIAREIILALDRNISMDINLIDVKVERGIVTMEGQVPDVSTYVEADDIASSADGVKEVRNNLQVAKI